MTRPRLPGVFWALWAGFLANRLGLLAPAFLTLYLTSQHVTAGAQTALAIGGYGAGTVIGTLLGGVVADRAGSRRTLWISQVLAGVAGIALMPAPGLPWVVGLLVVLGTCNGAGRSVGYGWVVLLVPAGERSAAYGRLYWATSIGNSVTTLLSGALLVLWPPAVFLPGALGAFGYAAAAAALPARRSTGARGHWPADAGQPFAAACVSPFLVMTVVLSAVYAQRHTTMPLDMYANGLSYGQLSLLTSFAALLTVVAQPLASRLTSRMPAGPFLALSALLISAGFWLNLFARTPAQYAATIAVWTYGEILIASLAPVFMGAHSPAHLIATYQGAYGLVWTLGFAVGAPVGHLVFTAAGRGVLWWGVLALGVAVTCGQLVLTRRCARRHPAREPPGGSDSCPRGRRTPTLTKTSKPAD